MHAILEILFLTAPVTVMSTLAGAIAGGMAFGPTGSMIGAAVGLVGGAALEIWLQSRIAAAVRAKWAGVGIMIVLLLAIGSVAIVTR